MEWLATYRQDLQFQPVQSDIQRLITIQDLKINSLQTATSKWLPCSTDRCNTLTVEICTQIWKPGYSTCSLSLTSALVYISTTISSLLTDVDRRH
jgi:hypothetical protein